MLVVSIIVLMVHFHTNVFSLHSALYPWQDHLSSIFFDITYFISNIYVVFTQSRTPNANRIAFIFRQADFTELLFWSTNIFTISAEDCRWVKNVNPNSSTNEFSLQLPYRYKPSPVRVKQNEKITEIFWSRVRCRFNIFWNHELRNHKFFSFSGDAIHHVFFRYTVDGMNNSLRPDVNAVRCTACSVSQQQFLAVLSIILYCHLRSLSLEWKKKIDFLRIFGILFYTEPSWHVS
jgi:hypothetical protein